MKEKPGTLMEGPCNNIDTHRALFLSLPKRDSSFFTMATVAREGEIPRPLWELLVTGSEPELNPKEPELPCGLPQSGCGL